MKHNTDQPYPKPPDLQEWIVKYDGYTKIPWAEWDAAIAQWQMDRRIFTAGTAIEGRKPRPAVLAQGRSK
jgi:hypothetical protein